MRSREYCSVKFSLMLRISVSVWARLEVEALELAL